MKRLSQYIKIKENAKRFFSILRKFNFSYLMVLLFSFLFIFMSLLLCLFVKAYILMIIILIFILMGGLIQNFAIKYDQYNDKYNREEKP